MLLKLKIRSIFPANVSVTSPITLVKTGLAYVFSFDVAALRTSILATTKVSLTSEVTGTLPVANGGSGVTTAAGEVARLGVGVLSVTKTGVNFNSANSDNALLLPALPTGYTRIIPYRVNISNASHTLVTATFGVFSAASAGGLAIVAAATAITVSATTDATANNCQSTTAVLTASFVAASLATASTLYFRVGTAEGATATADVEFLYFAAP